MIAFSQTWLWLALGSAFFAGLTSVLAKVGLSDTDSTVATAIRTVVVLAMAWLAAAVAGSTGDAGSLAPSTWLFLVLSGLATGASWLCYFRALQLGDVTQVVPVDKSSVVLTVILAWALLGEAASMATVVGIALVGWGTYLMACPRWPFGRNATRASRDRRWLWFALGSALFASLTAILGKMGMQGVESNLGTALRTGVVLVMAWVMVLVEGKAEQARHVTRKDLWFLVLSGLSTGASWLCYFRALQTGPASLVVPIDKLSIVVAVGLAFVCLHEKPSRRNLLGLAIIVLGTLVMLM